ncbi:MAG: thiolase family protein [Clostridia bacterium]
MEDAFLVDGVRSAFGRRGGALSGLRPDDLGAQVLNQLMDRVGLDPAAVEDVRLGCATQIGEQGLNLGRLLPLIAGWPVTVPGATVNRMCGSSLEALNECAQAIMAGTHDVMVACGVESMSRVPMLSDATQGFPPGLTSRFEIVPQGMSAELIAERWHLSREELDRFSLESHRRAIAAQDSGILAEEIVPVSIDGSSVATDEGPRRDTSLEKLAGLKTVFKADGVVTAGNSSQITDGAAAVVMASGSAVRRYDLKPLARVVAMALVGVDPVIMLTGPIPATEKVLQKAGLRFDQIDVVEINEAFASVVLAWGREYEPDWSRVNPHGGAISLGHPLGASGARLALAAARDLRRRQGRYALVTMCIGWGIGIATILENAS